MGDKPTDSGSILSNHSLVGDIQGLLGTSHASHSEVLHSLSLAWKVLLMPSPTAYFDGQVY